jgi:hypothetical protein
MYPKSTSLSERTKERVPVAKAPARVDLNAMKDKNQDDSFSFLMQAPKDAEKFQQQPQQLEHAGMLFDQQRAAMAVKQIGTGGFAKEKNAELLAILGVDIDANEEEDESMNGLNRVTSDELQRLLATHSQNSLLSTNPKSSDDSRRNRPLHEAPQRPVTSVPNRPINRAPLQVPQRPVRKPRTLEEVSNSSREREKKDKTKKNLRKPGLMTALGSRTFFASSDDPGNVTAMASPRRTAAKESESRSEAMREEEEATGGSMKEESSARKVSREKEISNSKRSVSTSQSDLQTFLKNSAKGILFGNSSSSANTQQQSNVPTQPQISPTALLGVKIEENSATVSGWSRKPSQQQMDSPDENALTSGSIGMTLPQITTTPSSSSLASPGISPRGNVNQGTTPSNNSNSNSNASSGNRPTSSSSGTRQPPTKKSSLLPLFGSRTASQERMAIDPALHVQKLQDEEREISETDLSHSTQQQQGPNSPRSNNSSFVVSSSISEREAGSVPNLRGSASPSPRLTMGQKGRHASKPQLLELQSTASGTSTEEKERKESSGSTNFITNSNNANNINSNSNSNVNPVPVTRSILPQAVQRAMSKEQMALDPSPPTPSREDPQPRANPLAHSFSQSKADEKRASNAGKRETRISGSGDRGWKKGNSSNALAVASLEEAKEKERPESEDKEKTKEKENNTGTPLVDSKKFTRVTRSSDGNK